MSASKTGGKSQTALRELEIVNMRGLHARASAKFVQTVAAHDARVEVEKDGLVVGGSSIMGLMMLAASPGAKITVRASGKDADKVLAALDELVSSGFGEPS
jgi:phosphocarrier protein HPr